MTIDERLEKLTERHEALTQSVELLTLEHRQFALEQQRTNQTLTTLVREIVGGIRDLTKIVRDHENRISQIEG
jgi:archaellum component FlaC